MGIFDFIFGKKSTKNKVENEPTNNVEQAPQHYRDLVSKNADIIEGMRFIATCQLRTPLWILKKHGEIHQGDGQPPIYGTAQDGVWIPKLSSDYNLMDYMTSASDAGQVNADEYLHYAIGLLTIFESNKPILDKMQEALDYSGNDEVKQRIERGILKCYREKNIADVMARYISDPERFEYYTDKPGKLNLVEGVNTRVASALEEAGIHSIKELSHLSESDLIKINGIGKVSARKIVSYFTTHAK